MSGNKLVNNRYIIFGGTGDLTYRKLMPAFYNLLVKGSLQKNDQIIIVGRRPLTIDVYLRSLRPWIKDNARLAFSDDNFKSLSNLISYCKMDISDLDDYGSLKDRIENNKALQTIVYLAIAPNLFKVATDGLCSIGQTNISVVMEKPFGDTLTEAKQLNADLQDRFGKENLYLIDHYLGKEMVRNILTIRCANPIFEKVWNSDNIELVEIEAMETVGVENRAEYYDRTGALKDMVQNHLLQILTIVALEDPSDMNSFKQQQRKILKALMLKEPIEQAILLGQYDGYLEEKGVRANSNTETFGAIRIFIDQPRWQDVPFVISSGKKTSERNTQVKITFKQEDKSIANNVLVIRIQPMEGVEMHFNIKTPGQEKGVTEAQLDFCQSCSELNRLNTPEAYEWMLESITKKEQFWFSEWEQIETSWRFIDKMKERFRNIERKLIEYPQGSNVSDLIKKHLL